MRSDKGPPKKWKAALGPKPIQKKNKKFIGLGKAIKNAKSRENEVEVLPDGKVHFKVDKHEANWVKLSSITQESALDAFLSTADLADKDFTADRHSNIKIIGMDNSDSIRRSQGFSLTDERKAILNKKHALDFTIPRRPVWNKCMTRFQLERLEKEAFLAWRRKLAQVQENNEDLLFTPFERNIEVWRQLWRVIERSDLVVQVVDARDPLLFRSGDLERYVKELDKDKQNLLLVNKADLLTRKQRIIWARYFIHKNIEFTFFSALRANELLKLQKEHGENNEHMNSFKEEFEDDKEVDVEILKKIKILGTDSLEELFMSKAPSEPLNPRPGQPPIIQIGLTGYPNVGKSSTINALIGSKKVSVSITPGKTKHFQTIKLSDHLMLCDCPGLVFPNFAFSKGELVCSGVLPIDQLREYVEPCTLVTERIPKYYLEAVYGIYIETRTFEEGGSGTPNAQELLVAYARARGYMTQGFGAADESRAARYILKDYVNGRLLYINPPPHLDDTPYTKEECREFNKDLYTFDHLPDNRKEQLLEAAKNKGIDILDLSRDLAKLTFSSHIGGDGSEIQAKLMTHGGKQAALYNASTELDYEFFITNRIQDKITTPLYGNQSKEHRRKHKKSKKQRM